jgi:hypothetical protein
MVAAIVSVNDIFDHDSDDDSDVSEMEMGAGMDVTDGPSLPSKFSPRVANTPPPPVTRVDKLRIREEEYTPWKPSTSLIEMVQKSMEKLIKWSGVRSGEGVMESYDEQKSALKAIINAVGRARDDLDKHRASEEKQLHARREVFMFDKPYQVFTEDGNLIYRSRDNKSYSIAGSAVHTLPRLYAETENDQIFKFTIDEEDFRVYDEPEKKEENRFGGRFVCISALMFFSYNPNLARSTLQDAIDSKSARGQAILAKKKGPLIGPDYGVKWCLALNDNNEFGLMPFTCNDITSIMDAQDTQWMQQHSDKFIKYKMRDDSLSLLGASVLAMAWRKSPETASALANNELAHLQACMTYLEHFRAYKCAKVSNASCYLRVLLEVFNSEGQSVYKESRINYGKPRVRVIWSNNGRFLPIKNDKSVQQQQEQQQQKINTCTTQ